MTLGNAALAMIAAFVALQAPGAANAERDPTGRWDTRETYRAQREQRLRKFEEDKKARDGAITGAPKREGADRPSHPKPSAAI